jgi:hypothetical protein
MEKNKTLEDYKKVRDELQEVLVKLKREGVNLTTAMLSMGFLFVDISVSNYGFQGAMWHIESLARRLKERECESVIDLPVN